MGIPLDKQELDVQRRWTRLNVDKGNPAIAATLTEETGAWMADGRWVTLGTRPHYLSLPILELLLGTPLKALKLGKDATVGDAANALLYGVLTGELPTTLTVAPVLKDADTGEVMEGGQVLFLNAPNVPGGLLPLDPPPQVAPHPGMKVMVQAASASMPVELDVPVQVGTWAPEVQVRRLMVPPSPAMPLPAERVDPEPPATEPPTPQE